MKELINKALELLKEFAPKLLSGRFILTIVTAIIFLYTAIRNIMPQDKVVEIVIMVFILYFTRNDRKPNGGGG